MPFRKKNDKFRINLRSFLQNNTFKGNIKSIAFIDLSLLLLIFIIFSTYFSVENGYKIELPNNKYADQFPASKLTIAIAPSSIPNQFNYYFNKRNLPFEEIEIELSKELKKRHQIFKKNGLVNYKFTLSLKADKKTPYELTSVIFNLAKKYNLNLIAISKKP